MGLAPSAEVNPLLNFNGVSPCESGRTPSLKLPKDRELLLYPLQVLNDPDLLEHYSQARNDPYVLLCYAPHDRKMEQYPNPHPQRVVEQYLDRKRVVFQTNAEMAQHPDFIRPLPCVVVLKCKDQDPTKEVTMPDGNRGMLVGLFAATNHQYDAPGPYELAIWTAFEAGQNLGQKIFSFATYVYVSQCCGAGVVPRLADMTLYTMKVNWKIVNIVVRMLPDFMDVIADGDLDVSVVDTDIKFYIKQRSVQRIVEKVCQSVEDCIYHPGRPQYLRFNESLDVKAIVQRYFPGTAFCRWVEYFQPLQAEVKRYCDTHPEQNRFDLQCCGIVHHVERTFRVPEENATPTSTKYVAVNVYSVQREAHDEFGDRFSLFLHISSRVPKAGGCSASPITIGGVSELPSTPSLWNLSNSCRSGQSTPPSVECEGGSWRHEPYALSVVYALSQ